VPGVNWGGVRSYGLREGTVQANRKPQKKMGRGRKWVARRRGNKKDRKSAPVTDVKTSKKGTGGDGPKASEKEGNRGKERKYRGGGQPPCYGREEDTCKASVSG